MLFFKRINKYLLTITILFSNMVNVGRYNPHKQTQLETVNNF